MTKREFAELYVMLMDDDSEELRTAGELIQWIHDIEDCFVRGQEYALLEELSGYESESPWQKAMVDKLTNAINEKEVAE